MKKIVSLALLLSGTLHSHAQWSAIPDEIKEYAQKECVLCTVELHDSMRIVTSRPQYSDCERHYHNCLVFYKKDDPDSAYKYAIRTGLSLSNNLTDSRAIITTLIKAKILYNKSLFYQSLTAYLAILNQPSISGSLKSYLYTNIGSNQVELGAYDKALPYLLDAVNRYGISDRKNLAVVYNNIGICYLHFKKIGKAECYFNKSIKIIQLLKDTGSLAYLYTNLANQYYNQYQDNLALKYFKKALNYALLTNDFSIKAIAYQNLAVVSENNRNYQSALIYRKLYEAQHDSLYNRDNIWGTAQEKNKLDAELHARKIQLAQQTNKLQLLELKQRSLEFGRQRQHLYIALVIAASFLSLFLLSYYAYRQKNKQNKIISAQRQALDALNHTKDQSFSIVAHDLRSPVQTLQVTLKDLKKALSEKNIGQAERVAGSIEAVSNGTYSLLNNLLYWALSQTGQLHFVKDKLNVRRLAEQVLYDYAPVADAKNITINNHVTDSLYCSGDMNTVKIILRNLVDNAIKFSEPFSSVVISGSDENDQCIISVTDSGRGIDTAVIEALVHNKTPRVQNAYTKSKSTGIGLWLVKTIAEKNGGSLQINRESKGTSMNIHLPKYLNHEQA